MRVLIRGAGDIATGVALRLYRSHMEVVMTDLPAPTAIRRTVCFSQAIVLGRTVVEDVQAAHAANAAEAEALLARMYAASFAQKVPVFSDDVLIACRQGSYVFDPSIHHLTRNACHFIGCPIHGESAK